MSDKPVIGKIEFGPALEAPTGSPPHVYTPAEELALSNALELVALTEQLATKDAEIAELRAALNAAEATAEEGEMNWRAEVSKALTAEQERNEARECVRRLCETLESAADVVHLEVHRRQDPRVVSIYQSILDALSAIPAHLR